MSEHLDLLTSLAGIKITNTEDWERFRRPELLMLLEDFVYGARPYHQGERNATSVSSPYILPPHRKLTKKSSKTAKKFDFS